MNDTSDGLRARRRANLGRLLKPRHIAFIGGSHLELCIGLCRRAGFPGDIHVVNPRRDEIAGIACTPTIDDLPEPPDAAFVALSRERTIDAMAELALAGAGGAVCHAAGFGELGGEHRDLQAELASAAGGMAMVGPNCMGVINAFDRVALWGADGHFSPVDGNGIALISQSGAFLYGLVNVERAYPMGYGLSLGNQAAIDIADVIDFALDDERVNVIGLYCEGLTNGQALCETLARAARQKIPVVLLAGGGVPEAAARSVSHTGNLAVPRDFWRALAERYALIEVTSIKQLIETTKLLCVGGVPKGNRIFTATMSGGAASLIAEQAPARGLKFTPVGETHHAKVRPTLPDVITISNPLDLNLPWQSKQGVSLADAGSIAQCLIDVSDGNTDAIAVMLDVPRGTDGYETPWLPTLEAMIEVRERTNLPTVASGLLPEGLEPHLREHLQAHGVAALMGMTETIEALAGAAHYAGAIETVIEDPPAGLLSAGSDGPTQTLDESDSKHMLTAYDLAMPLRWAGYIDGVPAAASRIGFPVVVKILDASIAHKSKIGGVRLNLASEAEVAEAVKAIQRNIAQARPDVLNEYFIVEQMAPPSVAELIIGVKRHAELGFVLLIGRGGVDAEVHRNYALTLLPASDRCLERTLDRLCLQLPALDARQSVVAAMRAVAEFATDHADTLVELDVNPLLVLEDGSVMAVDALVVITDDDNSGDRT